MTLAEELINKHSDTYRFSTQKEFIRAVVNDVIERCAKVAEDDGTLRGDWNVVRITMADCATRIRALKG